MFAIGLTIISNVLYHIFQKMTPASVHPMLSLVVTYFTAGVICLMLLPFFTFDAGLLESLRRINWVSIALGFAIFGLELGFLLAYRSQWDLSVAGLISNTAVAVLLLPIGLLFFREKLTPLNILGVAVCVLGLILINWK
jgi:drug/metabolite transporter (DMT)-like permease